MSLDMARIAARRGEFALGPLDLSLVDPITSIVGPNGAGKTTLLSCLTGQLAHEGSATWRERRIGLGKSGDWEDVAYVADSWPRTFDPLSPVEFWTTLADLRAARFERSTAKTLTLARELAERLEVPDVSHPCARLSLGTRRKVQLVGGLMFRTGLVLIDEPQNGLDFVATDTFGTILSDHVRDGDAQVVMTNHDLDSVARIADRVVALRAGVAVADLRAADFTGSDELRRELSLAYGSVS